MTRTRGARHGFRAPSVWATCSQGNTTLSTATKTPFAEGLAIAREFAKLFEGCAERWTIAGSLRRRRPEIGDVEHVVIPTLGEVTLPGEMFPRTGSLLWAKLEQLLAAGDVEKATYGETLSNRWGEKYRGVLYKGMKHEIFTADANNWGPILAIRTGPAEFSEELVTRLKGAGRLRMEGGYLKYQHGPNAGTVRPCTNEAEFLTLCGRQWIEPEDRR